MVLDQFHFHQQQRSLQLAEMRANYIRRLSCTIAFGITIGLVIHAAVKYQRYPFGIGGSSYRWARSSSYFDAESLLSPDDIVGGLYDAGSDNNDARPAASRSVDAFCLDGSPLPPRDGPLLVPSLVASAPDVRGVLLQNRNQRQVGDAYTTTSKTPSYHILNSNFSLTASLDKVAKEIKTKYIELIQASLNNRAPEGSCRPKFIEFRCSRPGYDCGSFGARLKGMAATFLTAMLTNSIFIANWDYPVTLETFFEAPILSKSILMEQFFQDQSPSELVIRAIDDEQELVWLLSDITRMRQALKQYDIIAFEINSLVPLEVLLSHPYYRSLVDYYDIINFSYSELFSIALRILLPEQTSVLTKATSAIVEHLRSSIYDARIGVQLHFRPNMGSDGIDSTLLQCFVDEFRNLTLQNNYQSVLVYATADDESALLQFKQKLVNLPDRIRVNVVTTDGKLNQEASLRTFADWVLLSSPELDHLLISKSLFGETASLFRLSAKTTRQIARNETTTDCFFNDFRMTSVWMETSSAPSSFIAFSSLFQTLIAFVLYSLIK